jgi:hypothetical protein
MRGSVPIRSGRIVVNEPKLIQAIVPAGLDPGQEYTLQIVTMSSVHGSSHILKNTRNIRSDFKLTARVAAAPAGEGDAGIVVVPDAGQGGLSLA